MKFNGKGRPGPRKGSGTGPGKQKISKYKNSNVNGYRPQLTTHMKKKGNFNKSGSGSSENGSYKNNRNNYNNSKTQRNVNPKKDFKGKQTKWKGKRGVENDDENVEVKEEVDDFNFETVNESMDSFGEFKNEESDDGDEIISKVAGKPAMQAQGKKNKNKKSGGFQAMGLSPLVLKGVLRRGYNVPTPIQRKAIPPILEGRDVVAMARTGSGKTAAFLIPLFERLQHKKSAIGTSAKFPRALILSPTRELATQTVKFIREVGKFIDFKVVSILGGESMDSQFQALNDKPDIVVATPGRFMHICVEMELKLDGVEYVCFDEADRLFEMGFGEQLAEILKRLPEHRQTVMFSATLPKLLVDFSKAGLSDPTLIRLDVDTKLPELLKLTYLACRSEDKLAALLYLLKTVIDENQQTIVFTATKHHVEYIHQLLDEANVSNCYIYSSLDPAARKISLGKFRSGKSNVMIVTDIAARGIDIPILDNVINFHFPAKPKLFMHRVGRVARAGRTGTAYSILCPDEIAFLIDLHLFLGKPLQFKIPEGESKEHIDSAFVGRIPQDLLNDENNYIRSVLETKMELETLSKVSKNGYTHYLRSRPNASTESNRRAKGIEISKLQVHPLFRDHIDEDPMDTLISQMQSYRPNNTIFEVGPKAGSETHKVMKLKRMKDQNVVERYRTKLASNSNEIEVTTEKTKEKEDEPYIPYLPKDHHTELGLSVGTTFDKQVQEAVMDLTGDDSDLLKKQQSMMKWDMKKKKYVSMGRDTNNKKIKTESGVWISASYKSDRYKEWMRKSKTEHQDNDDDASDNDSYARDLNDASKRKPALSKRLVKTGKNEAPRGPALPKGRKFRSEIKRPEQILKERKVKEKKMQKNLPKGIRKKRQRDGGGKKGKGMGFGSKKR